MYYYHADTPIVQMNKYCSLDHLGNTRWKQKNKGFHIWNISLIFSLSCSNNRVGILFCPQEKMWWRCLFLSECGKDTYSDALAVVSVDLIYSCWNLVHHKVKCDVQTGSKILGLSPCCPLFFHIFSGCPNSWMWRSINLNCARMCLTRYDWCSFCQLTLELTGVYSQWWS